jgi:hypothetical protein
MGFQSQILKNQATKKPPDIQQVPGYLESSTNAITVCFATKIKMRTGTLPLFHSASL